MKKLKKLSWIREEDKSNNENLNSYTDDDTILIELSDTMDLLSEKKLNLDVTDYMNI